MRVSTRKSEQNSEHVAGAVHEQENHHRPSTLLHGPEGLPHVTVLEQAHFVLLRRGGRPASLTIMVMIVFSSFSFAKSSAVLPSKSFKCRLMPFTSSFRTILVLPCIVARCSAVTPVSVSCLSRADPHEIRKLTELKALFLE